MVKEYDYIVIGGGSGGIASANRAAMHGAKVILFEGKEVGGTCVNVGCVPKKVMWYGAQVAETLHRYAGEYGFDVTVNKFDFARLKANRQAYIDRIHGSYERGFDSNGVERVYEYARFVDPHTVEVAGELYTAPHILIATGGHALYPNIPGSEYGITSDGFFELDEVPNVQLLLVLATSPLRLLVFSMLLVVTRISLFVRIAHYVPLTRILSMS